MVTIIKRIIITPKRTDNSKIIRKDQAYLYSLLRDLIMETDFNDECRPYPSQFRLSIHLMHDLFDKEKLMKQINESFKEQNCLERFNIEYNEETIAM